MIAQFVTVWDGGSVVSTPCQYDPVNRMVSGIVMTEDPGFDNLEETYVELGDGEQVRDFYDEDNAVQFIAGQPERS